MSTASPPSGAERDNVLWTLVAAWAIVILITCWRQTLRSISALGRLLFTRVQKLFVLSELDSALRELENELNTKPSGLDRRQRRRKRHEGRSGTASDTRREVESSKEEDARSRAIDDALLSLLELPDLLPQAEKDHRRLCNALTRLEVLQRLVNLSLSASPTTASAKRSSSRRHGAKKSSARHPTLRRALASADVLCVNNARLSGALTSQPQLLMQLLRVHSALPALPLRPAAPPPDICQRQKLTDAAGHELAVDNAAMLRGTQILLSLLRTRHDELSQWYVDEPALLLSLIAHVNEVTVAELLVRLFDRQENRLFAAPITTPREEMLVALAKVDCMQVLARLFSAGAADADADDGRRREETLINSSAVMVSLAFRVQLLRSSSLHVPAELELADVAEDVVGRILDAGVGSFDRRGDTVALTQSLSVSSELLRMCDYSAPNVSNMSSATSSSVSSSSAGVGGAPTASAVDNGAPGPMEGECCAVVDRATSLSAPPPSSTSSGVVGAVVDDLVSRVAGMHHPKRSGGGSGGGVGRGGGGLADSGDQAPPTDNGNSHNSDGQHSEPPLGDGAKQANGVQSAAEANEAGGAEAQKDAKVCADEVSPVDEFDGNSTSSAVSGDLVGGRSGGGGGGAPPRKARRSAPATSLEVKLELEAVLQRRLARLLSLAATPREDSFARLDSSGRVRVPLGSARLKIVELLCSCAIRASAGMLAAMQRAATAECMLNLFVKHEGNSILHNAVSFAVRHALEGGDEDRQALWIRAQLARRLADAWQTNNANEVSKARPRAGYMGHVITLSRCLHAFVMIDPARALRLMGAAELRAFEDFCSATLTDDLRRETAFSFGER